MDLKDKIKVMQHFAEGGKIEYRRSDLSPWRQIDNPDWDWQNYNYRIRQSPIAAGHNPPNLTEDQVECDKDWRLLQEHGIKPKTKQPLSAADFPPGTVVCRADTMMIGWFLVLYVGGLSISIQSQSTLLYTDLLAQWQYSTDQGKTWLPCYKEV